MTAIAYRERVREGSLKGKRVALSPTLGLAEPEPAVRAAVERAAEVFRSLGAEVEAADPFPQPPTGIFEPLALAAFWALLRALPPQAHAVMDPGLVALCRRGERVTQEEYVDAVARRAALGQALRLFFDRYDLLLSPTMPIAAAYAEPRADDRPNPNNFPDWMPYTPPFNLTKNPAASIPCGFVDGLPVGLQVTGPLYGDLAVLQACRAYQEATDGAAWPVAGLEARLAAIAAAPDAGVAAKALDAKSVASAGDRAILRLHRRKSAAYSPSAETKGGCHGKQGAETHEPGSEKAQAEKERRRQEVRAAAGDPGLTGGSYFRRGLRVRPMAGPRTGAGGPWLRRSPPQSGYDIALLERARKSTRPA